MTKENVFAQIDSICREFRRQCRAAASPRIEDFLPGVDQSAGTNLFRNLLHIEIEYRRRSHESPSSDEYARRFPQYAAADRQRGLDLLESLGCVLPDAEVEYLSLDRAAHHARAAAARAADVAGDSVCQNTPSFQEASA